MVAAAYGPHFDGWWTAAMAAMCAGSRIPWAVRRQSDGAVIGTTSLYEIRPEHRRCEVGSTFYRPETRGGPVNPACKRLLLDHAFAAGAVRVEIITDALNPASQAAIRKLGARDEGVLARHKITWTGRIETRPSSPFWTWTGRRFGSCWMINSLDFPNPECRSVDGPTFGRGLSVSSPAGCVTLAAQFRPTGPVPNAVGGAFLMQIHGLTHGIAYRCHHARVIEINRQSVAVVTQVEGTHDAVESVVLELRPGSSLGHLRIAGTLLALFTVVWRGPGRLIAARNGGSRDQEDGEAGQVVGANGTFPLHLSPARLPGRSIELTFGHGGRSCASTPEELTEKVAAFGCQHSAFNAGLPVTGRLVEHAGSMDYRAALGVIGTPDNPADSGVADRACAHGAGLKRHIKC